CPEGITRAAILELAAADGIPCDVADVSLPQLWCADELFVTGTMGGVAPVVSLDGRAPRASATGAAGPVTKRLTDLYAGLTAREGTPV
ncbi:MAG TPA: aminotransferase class IV, partial [Streptosporangiaceae bacterium]|nr:aminotransferase class IV [Streptosporangiaceae bacterium]